jgi:3-deoxy-D-manno-octulosonate 8-phosphate phosphatase (KDO 8-P phosphatase)
MSNFKGDLNAVRAFVFDVDGVFTDGNVYLHPSGDMMRSMNIKDGYAIQHAIKQGYIICIISGGRSESVRTRFKKLGVTDIYLGSNYKMDDFEDFLYKYSLKAENILYMGDDLPDYEIMKEVGMPTCPLDAAQEIKNISRYISDKKGGEGCVRDIIEQVLRLQGKWLNDEAFIW